MNYEVPVLQKEIKHRPDNRADFNPKKGPYGAKEWKDGREAEENYTLYCLTESGSRVRYFGITKETHSHRLQEHINESMNGDGKRKSVWIRECFEKGTKIQCHALKSSLSKKRALLLESSMIRLFQSAFDLVNTQKHSLKRECIIKKARFRNPCLALLRKRGRRAPDFKIQITTESGDRKTISVSKHGKRFISAHGFISARTISQAIEKFLRTGTYALDKTT